MIHRLKHCTGARRIRNRYSQRTLGPAGAKLSRVEQQAGPGTQIPLASFFNAEPFVAHKTAASDGPAAQPWCKTQHSVSDCWVMAWLRALGFK